jgi:hypothetical protein
MSVSRGLRILAQHGLRPTLHTGDRGNLQKRPAGLGGVGVKCDDVAILLLKDGFSAGAYPTQICLGLVTHLDPRLRTAGKHAGRLGPESLVFLPTWLENPRKTNIAGLPNRLWSQTSALDNS